ncbi:polycomb protein EED [Hyalella azteca]|uniref:Polycomb protein esc n=2 Tax=Hyalella azteca TaxID=294128 RepID=A0A8B7NYY0_HYAAZ|nr:polycomb protein EED [Hyalella azteca]
MTGPNGDTSSIADSEDQDMEDTWSVGSGSNADNTSRSTTPTMSAPAGPHKRGKAKRGRKKAPQPLPPQNLYKFVSFLKEDHGQPLFGVAFNQYLGEGQPAVFATAGSNRVSVYQCEKNASIRLLQCYADPDPEENFYSVAWSYDTETGHPLLAAGGARGVVRLFSIATMTCTKHFTGHGNAINEVKFHPGNPDLLLSVSKDHAMRLWNVRTDILVALLGGVEAHRDEVLSADIDVEGRYLVSCGMDHSLKIWSLTTEAMQNAIKDSYTFNPARSNQPFATVEQNFPDFSTRDIHRNYVDCVRWLGNLVLSKSCENTIVCWKPGLLNQTELKLNDTNVTILHKFDYKECQIWFMRFSLDFWQRMLAVGNQQGKIYVWEMTATDPRMIRPSTLSHPRCTAAIRQTAFSRDASILIGVCDDATIWRWEATPNS